MRLLTLLTMIAAATLALAQPPHNVHYELPSEQRDALVKAIKAAPIYERDKVGHIDSLTRRYRNINKRDLAARCRVALHLCEDYMPMRADSAMQYSGIALALADSSRSAELMTESRIARIGALSNAGIFSRAALLFDSIHPQELSQRLKIKYFQAGRKLYGFMRLYVEGEQEFMDEYTALYVRCDDSLLRVLPAGDRLRDFLQCERLISKGDYLKAKPRLETLLKSVPQSDNLYGMTAYQLAVVYLNSGDQSTYAAYLAEAAISDIKGCIKDGLALPTLAEWLYEQGEINDAFNFINYALEDATSGNIRMRTVTIASLLPLIDTAYREKINASRDELMIYFLLTATLLIITGGLLFILMRQIKRARASERKVKQTAGLQEKYIGHFIELSSTYANRLQTLRKTVGRKIASGQADELLKMIDSGKFNDSQNEAFCTVFDSAFLDLYPDFVEGINNLLRPEERIDSAAAHTLTPELRIYAIVRLGVDESVKIAQILNYSVATVYSYRNRMRNRAISRESFDEDVKRGDFRK